MCMCLFDQFFSIAEEKCTCALVVDCFSERSEHDRFSRSGTRMNENNIIAVVPVVHRSIIGFLLIITEARVVHLE